MIVSGYFSPLHCGHLDMLEAAAERADEVFVIVNNNHQQVAKKGKLILDEADRLRIVNALRLVDEAMIAIDEDRSVSASIAAIADRFGATHRLSFGNGGDRESGQVVPETGICAERGIEMVFDLGGNEKRDSSNRINMELGIEDRVSAGPSETT